MRTHDLCSIPNLFVPPLPQIRYRGVHMGFFEKERKLLVRIRDDLHAVVSQKELELKTMSLSLTHIAKEKGKSESNHFAELMSDLKSVLGEHSTLIKEVCDDILKEHKESATLKVDIDTAINSCKAADTKTTKSLEAIRARFKTTVHGAPLISATPSSVVFPAMATVTGSAASLTGGLRGGSVQTPLAVSEFEPLPPLRPVGDNRVQAPAAGAVAGVSVAGVGAGAWAGAETGAAARDNLCQSLSNQVKATRALLVQAQANCETKRAAQLSGGALGSRKDSFAHMNAAVYGTSVQADVRRACDAVAAATQRVREAHDSFEEQCA